MSTWGYLLRLYRPRSGWLLVAFLSLTVTWLSAAALLAVSGWFITACAMAGLGMIANLNIFTPSTAIRGLALLRTIGRYVERVVGHEAILRILADLRVRAFSAVAQRPANQTDTARHADVVNRLTADVDTLDGVPLRVIGPLFAAVLTWVTVVIIGGIWGGTTVALVIGIGGTLTFAAAIWGARAGQAQGIAVIQARSEQRVALTDHLGGLAELLAFKQTRASDQYLAQLDAKQTQRLMHQERFASIAEHAVQSLTAAMTLVVLGLTWPVLDAPTVTLLALMTLGMNEALGTLPGAFWRVGESEQAARRLMQLESTADQAPAAEANPKQTVGTQAHSSRTIDIVDLRCLRQPNPDRSLNHTLQPGRPLVIHGASGTGKTSLLATMAGELLAQTGEVRSNGTNLLALNDHDRYRHIGFLSQNDQLLDLSIREFLSLGLDNGSNDSNDSDNSDEMLRAVLQQVDLLETLENTTEGFNYRLGVSGSRISGGQARRLQLAALLLREPELVLLDEPFRGLQPELVQTIIARITPWLAQRCCVVVTHDPRALPERWPRQAWPL
ncbi:MAG TPA: ATP-binding cassette domain-containing protein [Orrella sp.]